jgi:hypothetical protein
LKRSSILLSITDFGSRSFITEKFDPHLPVETHPTPHPRPSLTLRHPTHQRSVPSVYSLDILVACIPLIALKILIAVALRVVFFLKLVCGCLNVVVDEVDEGVVLGLIEEIVVAINFLQFG